MQFFIINGNVPIYYKQVNSDIFVSFSEVFAFGGKINVNDQLTILHEYGNPSEKHIVFSAIKSSIGTTERFRWR